MGTSAPPPYSLDTLSKYVLASTKTEPANAVFISPEDKLYMILYPSVTGITVSINLRVLTPDGVISISRYDYVTFGTRSPQVRVLPAGMGLVMGATIFISTGDSISSGQIYAVLAFIRGSITDTPQYTQVLIAGYVIQGTPLFYPFGQVSGMMDGRGHFRIIVGTDPAPGQELNETVPSGAAWALISFRAGLVTSAGGAARGINIFLADGPNAFFENNLNVDIGPSGNITLNVAVGAENSPSAGAGVLSMFLPAGAILPAGFRFGTVTFGLQPGDQYNSLVYLVEEWIQQ